MNSVALRSLITRVALLATTAIPSAFAQQAPFPAQYDKNGNGVLDPEERSALEADRAKPAPAVSSNGSMTSGAAGDTPVQLSPFEVVSDNTGYYAANTMSGTRLNAKIEDLGSSITVVTKDQMKDFALLDINDVFLYEAGTESSATFTSTEIDRFGNVSDGVQSNPQGANRIRGVGAANVAFGNFQTSGRVPTDPINVEAVEISRGPNSSIFGLGNASGTVNMVPATANVQTNRSEVELRGDSYGGYRGSLDLNRVLISGKLAMRGSFVQQHDGFIRKPSGTDSKRYNVMLKYQPFRSTTLRLNYEQYHLTGTRPNSVTPRDGVSYWKSVGSPTWDPVTSTAKLNGAVVGQFLTGTGLPNYFQTSAFNASPSVFVGQGGIGFWSVNQTSNTNNPSTANQPIRFLESAPAPVRAGQPLFSSVPTVSDKSIYDWTSYNLSAFSAVDDRVKTLTASLDQILLERDRHLLALQLGVYRENADRYNRNQVGVSDRSATGFLLVDVNERLLDGRPNPFFLRPYISAAEPFSSSEPLDRDIYRAQLAYRIDLAKEKNWMSWLGTHQFSGYYEYKDAASRRYRFRDVIVSDHAWLPAGTVRGNSSPTQPGPVSPTVTRQYFRYYVGDANGQNVDYSPPEFRNGSYTFNWYNGATGAWVAENAVLGQASSLDQTGALFNTHNILKTAGVVLQSHLLKGRVVTTVGIRSDKSFNMLGAPARLLPNGLDVDHSVTDTFTGGWVFREGKTKTAGVVVKPTAWLSLHANRSDSFQPEQPAQSVLRTPLPDPQGKGEDYGLTLTLLDGRLVIRANQYKTEQINSRAGQSAVYGQRTVRLDFGGVFGTDAFALDTQATAWITEAAANRGVTLTPDQLDTELASVMKLTKQDLAQFRALPISETSDVIAKGKEIEINYNPNRFWTIKANVTQQETIDANLTPNVPKWVAIRLPVWQSVIDPRTGTPWFTNTYGGGTASNFLAGNVTSALKLAQATEGKSRPQIRKYRVNFSTNYKLAGLTEQRFLKKINVGGALRWEDKGAIGFYGLQELPASITDYDPNRPIWDKAHLYVDAFVGYRTKIYDNKVGASLQLNVRNLTENGGGLQPISAYPNGVPSGYRIIDPRQFILSASFDL